MLRAQRLGLLSDMGPHAMGTGGASPTHVPHVARGTTVHSVT